jgi:hypothetical protein
MAALFFFRSGFLDGDYVLRLEAFLALDNGKFYTLAFFQVAVSVANDGVEMDEYIFAFFAFNKTVAFATIEPLYGALLFFRHDLELLSKIFFAS